MNITLSVDERLLRRARKAAEAMGKSLNQLVRDQLEAVVMEDSSDRFDKELRRLSVEGGGHSHGWRFDREEAHERS